MKYILTIMALVVSVSAFAQVDCNNLATFPDVAVLGGTTKKCVATCPLVQAPRCADTDGIFPQVYPHNQKAIGDYTDVVCSDLTTFPFIVRQSDGQRFRKCVQKCQNIRPPKCVDYNSELR